MATASFKLVDGRLIQPEAFVRVWRAPLVPIALAFTSGIVLDRSCEIPLQLSLLVLLASLVTWVVVMKGGSTLMPPLCLAISSLAFGVAYYHLRMDTVSTDDLARLAKPEAQPIHFRGYLEQEPSILWQNVTDPLRSIPRTDPTLAVVEVTRRWDGSDWQMLHGRVQMSIDGHLEGFHAGDEIEVVGRLIAPSGPANPGEFDYRTHLRENGIGARVTVRSPEAITRLAERWPGSLEGWLGVVRGWGQRALKKALPPQQSGVATALLLGEGSTMTNDDWEKYIRTGVIHVLAISGQHLVVLALFLKATFRIFRVRRRQWMVWITLFLVGYALLAGGRPPVMRSAVAVSVVCLSVYLRRFVMFANSFAMSWIIVGLLNPADLFGAGCQLSFLSVAMLHWGTGRWLRAGEFDPLARLAEESRPRWLQGLRWVGKQVAQSYAITFLIWLAVAPLVASRYHLVSVPGLIIGPPVVVLTSIALLAGFVLLLLSLVGGPLVPVAAWVTRWCLAGCEWLVDAGDAFPGSHWYLSDIPEWWLWIFYAGLFGALTVPVLQQKIRWVGVAGIIWLCVGLSSAATWFTQGEFRCTFLAVGHGGCTVLETPDGRTLLYDAGALAGPEVTRRQIAPFLWSRGIRRIDEVILSHADLDHFNGLPSLMDRFAIGQVTCNPSFADKHAPGVQKTLELLQNRGIPRRIVRAGDQLQAGEVRIDVLHPPASGPEGNENSRSLVLLITHAGHALLLTGDLEGAGLERLLALPSQKVDILMAPHHGSRAANTPRLAQWARPRLAIACQGPVRTLVPNDQTYKAAGSEFLGTYPHGAITVRSHATGLVVETFATQQRIAVRSR